MPGSNALQITQFANFAVYLMPTLTEKQKAQIINGYWKHRVLSILTLVNSWKGQFFIATRWIILNRIKVVVAQIKRAIVCGCGIFFTHVARIHAWAN